MTSIYYKKLKNLIIETKRLAIATQANTNYQSKIYKTYKIYNNNQILLKMIETIKLTIN